MHVPAFRAQEGCSVDAIAASDISRARNAGDALGIERRYGHWQDLVEDPALDIVSIAVPPRVQPDIAISAARAGKHVLCEKPIAASEGEAEQMAEQVAAAGVVHAVDFEFPELPEWRAARELVDSGAVGAVTDVSIEWKVKAGARRSSRSAWKERDDQGGGTLGGFVSHALYHAELFMGTAAQLSARTVAIDDAVAACEILLQGPSQRALIVVDTHWDGLPRHSVAIAGTAGRLSLTSHAARHAEGFELYIGDRMISRSVSDGTTDGRIAAVSGLVARFVAAIRSGHATRPNLSDGLRIQRLLAAARLSARSGQEVSI